jgi:hypothetical protein
LGLGKIHYNGFQNLDEATVKSPKAPFVPYKKSGWAAWLPRGYEARENGSFRVRRRDRDDVWQHPLKPRHLPFRGFREHPLHIAKVDRILAGRSVSE